ncbi:MAG: AraC family transcriptional regulator [Deltaproteobacteria bacterium]|nr:AraC family transcriptional regulator [Deltaproteobacteria bacterium]
MPENEAPTSSMVLAAYAMKIASDEGLPVKDICMAAGVNPADLADLNLRIDIALHQRLLAETVRISGNPTFWLLHIKQEYLNSNNLPWQYYFNAPNIREAIRRTDYHYRFLNDVLYPAQIESEDGFQVRMASRDPNYHYSIEQVDFGLSQWHGTLEIFTGPVLKLLEVRLVTSSVHRQTAYRRFYGVPVRMGQPYDELVYAPETVNLPNCRKSIEPGLDSYILQLLKPLIEQRPQEPFRESACIAIQQELIHGLPTLDKISGRLGMTRRTLQRRLQERQLTFTGLIDESRRCLAEYYLRYSPLNIADIGLLLGFADHAALTKAFRKWHGMSPREFRKKYSAESAPPQVTASG